MSSVSPKLVPFLQDLNKLIAEAKASGVAPTPDAARKGLDGLAKYTTVVPEIAYSSDKTLEVEGRSIPVRVYSPAPEEELPVCVYSHGGGHMCGSVELYDPMCRKLALAANCVVVSVDYRLAPENPYPAGVEDSYQVAVNYKQLLTDLAFNDELIIAGDSGGGAVTSTLVMRSQTDSALNFNKQVLIYPSVDYTMVFPSIEHNGTGYLLEKGKIGWYFDNYLQNNEDRRQVSPLYTPLNAKPVPTLVITAGLDPLYDEGVAYFEMVKASGAYAEHCEFPDLVHAFMNLEDLIVEECQRLYGTIGEFIKRPL